MKRIVWLIFCLFAVSATAVAAPEQDNSDEAGKHFKRGVQLYREGGYDGALAEFSKAYELSPNYRLLYNMAQVQAERHDYVAAIELFERYLSEGEEEIPAERAEEVRGDIAVLAERVGEVSIRLNVSGAELFVDGVSKGTVGKRYTVKVNPGSVELELRKGDRTPYSTRAQVTGGEVVELNVELKPKAPPEEEARKRVAPPPEPPPPDDAEPRYSYTPAWIGLATTITLGGASTIFGILTTKTDERLDTELDRFPADEDAIAKERKDLRMNAALADGFGVGAIVAGAVTTYFFISPSEIKESNPSTGSLAVSISATGASVSGSF